MIRNVTKLLGLGLACLLPAAAAWADGAVYAMTNALGNNQVLVYHRAADGSLGGSPNQTIATGGGGSGLQEAGVDSLGSAGSIQLDYDHGLLFVVNTESAAENDGTGAYNTDCRQGTITSLRVAADGSLTFADRVFSGGLFPNSLTVKKNGKGNNDKKGELLYVLNAGGPEAPAICNLTPGTANLPNITGFSVDERGHMTPIDSTQPVDPGPAMGSGENCPPTGFPFETRCGLNPPSFVRSPAQIAFTPDGTQLVVTVKGTNAISVFPVDKSGSAGSPATTQASAPAVPSYFGVAFAGNGDLLVAEPFGSGTTIPTGGAGAVSSFAVGNAGNLASISSHINDGATAPAAIALEPIVGRLAYVSNNLSASISSYIVGNSGVVTLLNGTAAAPAAPNDLATAAEGNTSFLYVVDAASGTVGAFRINGDGSLSALAGGSGLPANRSAQGLAAF